MKSETFILIKTDDELLGSVSVSDETDAVRWFCNGCGRLVPDLGEPKFSTLANATRRLLLHLESEHER